MSQDLHPLAAAANARLASEAPIILSMLSQRGRALYFPAQGILAQGAEAKSRARFANATIGIATEDGEPMHLPCVQRYFRELPAAEIYDYAPSAGRPELRRAWAAKQRREMPSLGAHPTSLPVVTQALTHGLALVGELFLDPGDEVLTSDLMWENYALLWETRLGARLCTFPLFDARLSGLDLAGLRAALAARHGRKLMVVLNFPNNPSGYTPTPAEAAAIVAALSEAAAAGTRLIAVCDDAYYGMFFDEASEREPLFGKLAQAHPNLLAVKIDGATKEAFVWGLRIGFITYGCAGGTPTVYEALEQKTAGLIRATVSNVSMPGQSIVLRLLQDPAFRDQQGAKIALLRRRAAATMQAARSPEHADCWDVYPFNSGYFMCLRLKGATAEAVRQELLQTHGVGTIALGERQLRVAFSCLSEAQIAEVFARIAQAVRTVRGRQ
ncbi:MAG: aminotransferase class I/II-fold pyridoxal phosphate-dependent enzyme [Planctomycetes bacterium]|nr:aminotransferase class I/II-fold pyridoxal phosphate-dependent enzyme [Planctomycetota bacterium]